ncbi:hypothetical protein J9317_03050 [Metabacillus sp. KIGAM252]|uniref:CcoQ/FixQ family Cbb3-type cytochrome c oxidase assembly chaperone n=1 Tax=Metabacillus flavus TaxID=2823519 RepID=A0ABS5LAK1_9BACI|nr:hypothetical protein [Metabacillus flavus]MBS2967752.1 hypothetical protein [Metabacillus flavus]
MITSWWLLTAALFLFLIAAIFFIFFALKTGIRPEDSEHIDPLADEADEKETDAQK